MHRDNCINDKFLTWSDLKRFVIDKSVNEINHKNDLNISYEPKNWTFIYRY
ncbi:RepB family plasmid replication initiator protein [Gilliamella apicola]|uniref:RepB family plasmid replication initiator protein n=1 Tax=Gilliamella sp. Fer4-1 TaxID=3120242 RepID=UPI001146DB26